jgi:hypothetical protein
VPAKIDRCVRKLMDKGKSKDSAFAICTNAIMKKRKKKKKD